MSNDIATISLRVNTSELERGNQALDRFQETASAAAGKADDLNSTFRTGIDNQKKNSESLKQQRQELQNLLNKISPVNKALDELDTIQESLSKFRNKGLVGDEDFTRYNSVLETTRAKLAQVMESETAEGRAGTGSATGSCRRQKFYRLTRGPGCSYRKNPCRVARTEGGPAWRVGPRCANDCPTKRAGRVLEIWSYQCGAVP
ncbi:hypothetical protein [Enterobacter hormaechei]|uniref:hypothetical protein n=1 Tax=Enterobacter hormaechei TaxID=158836 RepID=UPI00273A44F6|nr:hypothetical protein [Enterobacter hormaechei]MDZ5682857.1 hypothetical protein [Enterobacter hormaechei]WLP09824.1 hypothetical protein Q8Z25_18245 [Enterobacter hormaechei]